MPVRNILLHLNTPQDLTAVGFVMALAADLGARELTAVAAGGVTPPGHGVPVGPGLMLLRAGEIEETFLRMQSELVDRTTGLRLEWRSEVTADPTAYLAAQAARADLLILSREPSDAGTLGDLDAGRLVLTAGRPVLILPAALPTTRFRKVAIAYRETREGRLAVLEALPILKQADQAIVIGVTPECPQGALDDVVAHLGSHGVFAEARPIQARGTTAEAVLDAAQGFGADLLVSGAFGHGRARERLFGGVTRDLLAVCPLPWLAVH